MSDHGNAEGISIHRTAGEPLCTACMAYLNRLQREMFRSDRVDGEDVVRVTLPIPSIAFYELTQRADAMGLTVEDYIAGLAIDSVQGAGRGLTFSKEKQIRALWVAGKSTAEISRTVKVAYRTVQNRIERWGGQSNYRPGRPAGKASK
ncbi:hypothetical protein SEA_VALENTINIPUFF_103 [Microbacterium phage ValentiniPuff]|uniref:Uncharacterized protein n=1 Tax=Microbacterium phage ValentiniPuff TaxID=2315705 RepID=A0A386KSR5_9CAUD|nr:hypothetical protein SEA_VALENTINIPUFF_103 [Microbacterium phage ValentiniPuff]